MTQDTHSATPAANNAAAGTALLNSLRPLLTRIHAARTLSTGKVGILRHLAEHGRATTTELATSIQVSPQGASLAARELEELGFIERVTDDADRRRVWISLTESGEKRLADELVVGVEWLRQSINGSLSPDELIQLEKVVIPILNKIGSVTNNA